MKRSNFVQVTLERKGEELAVFRSGRNLPKLCVICETHAPIRDRAGDKVFSKARIGTERSITHVWGTTV